MSDIHTTCTQCDRKILILTYEMNAGLCGVCMRELREKQERESRVVNDYAAKSPEELVMLQAVVRQLTEIEPKEAYAAWLEEHGLNGRAKFLRQLMVAHESLQPSDLSDFDDVEPCWSRMIGAPYLQALIEYGQELSFEQRKTLRDRVYGLAEPCIVMRYEEYGESDFDPEPGQSRYFGHPDLPPSVPWPSYGDCLHDFEDTDGVIDRDSPCFFACQVRTRDLWPMVAGYFAEQDKLLSFFTFVETETLGSQSACVIASEDLSNLSTVKQPAKAHVDNEFVSVRQIHFTEELSLPDKYRSCFESTLALDEFGDLGRTIYEQIIDAGRTPWDEDLSVSLAMFGYLQSSSGDDPTPTTKHRRLALVRCSVDAGIVHLGIDSDALAQQAWEKATMVWNDWDS